MFVIVIGCGRTGSKLAGELSKDGHDVVVVDKDNDRFGALPIEFSGFKIEGDALEQETLRNAKIDQADRVIVTTGNDKINYMVTQLSRVVFGVPLILVRVVDPNNIQLFDHDSSVETLSPISLLVEEFTERLKRNEG